MTADRCPPKTPTTTKGKARVHPASPSHLVAVHSNRALRLDVATALYIGGDRGVFYPKGLPQAKELAYAGERLTAIEINATYYGSQKPESFRKWASSVPNGFVFSVKASRFATNRKVLREAGDSIKRFVSSGVLELGDRLGPLLWQFAPFKKFDEVDFGGFL